MALYELTLQNNAVDVAVSHSSSAQLVRIAVLHNKGLSIYDWNPAAKSPTPPTLTRQASISGPLSTTRNQQICCIGENRVVVLQSQLQVSKLHEFLFGSDSRDQRRSSATYKTDIRISGLTGDLGRDGLCMVLETNKVMILRSEKTDTIMTHDMATAFVTKGMVYTPWIEVVQLPGSKLTNGHGSFLEPSNNIVFGLSNNGSLYANDRLLTRNCTSFLVTSAHLIFTTTQHLLKFVHMTDVEGRQPRILILIFY